MKKSKTPKREDIHLGAGECFLCKERSASYLEIVLLDLTTHLVLGGICHHCDRLYTGPPSGGIVWELITIREM